MVFCDWRIVVQPLSHENHYTAACEQQERMLDETVAAKDYNQTQIGQLDIGRSCYKTLFCQVKMYFQHKHHCHQTATNVHVKSTFTTSTYILVYYNHFYSYNTCNFYFHFGVIGQIFSTDCQLPEQQVLWLPMDVTLEAEHYIYICVLYSTC